MNIQEIKDLKQQTSALKGCLDYCTEQLKNLMLKLETIEDSEYEESESNDLI